MQKMMTVRLKSGIPGVIIGILPKIEKYNISEFYSVQWVDGNVSVHHESELTEIYNLRAANDDTY